MTRKTPVAILAAALAAGGLADEAAAYGKILLGGVDQAEWTVWDASSEDDWRAYAVAPATPGRFDNKDTLLNRGLFANEHIRLTLLFHCELGKEFVGEIRPLMWLVAFWFRDLREAEEDSRLPQGDDYWRKGASFVATYPPISEKNLTSAGWDTRATWELRFGRSGRWEESTWINGGRFPEAKARTTESGWVGTYPGRGQQMTLSGSQSLRDGRAELSETAITLLQHSTQLSFRLPYQYYDHRREKMVQAKNEWDIPLAGSSKAIARALNICGGAG